MAKYKVYRFGIDRTARELITNQKTLLKNQHMHLFQHFHINIKNTKRLLKMFYKSVIYK
jgi:hypothetical protein